jgi:hypothetical protein
MTPGQTANEQPCRTPDVRNVVAIREAATQSDAVHAAGGLSASYGTAKPRTGPDGADEHGRVSSMSAAVADTIRASSR